MTTVKKYSNKNPKQVLQGILIVLISLVVILILVEIFLLLFHPIPYRKPAKKLSDKVWSNLLHRKSAIPGLTYELNPNKSGFSHGARIYINSHGMRDSEPYPISNNKIHRIVVLGDSITFGFGVRARNTYVNVLERLLNGNHESKIFEVHNLGVGGYCTRDEALVLKYKGLYWKPALVILGYFLNDPEIDPIQPLHAYFQDPLWWQHLNILRLVASLKNLWDIKRFGQGDYFSYLHAPDRDKWQSVVRAFSDMADMVRKKNTPVLLLIFPKTVEKPWSQYPYLHLHKQVSQTAKKFGFHVIDLLDSFTNFPPRKLMIKPEDSHPSAFGHRLVAEQVYQWLIDNRDMFTFSFDKVK